MDINMLYESVALATVLVLMLAWFTRGSTKLPGPRGWPIVGNAWQLNNAHPHLTFEDWRKKYGGVFKVNQWGTESVIVCDYEHIYEVLVTRGNDYAGRPQSYRNELISEGCNDIFFTDWSTKWKTIRQALEKCLKAQVDGSMQLEEIESSEIDNMLRAFMDEGERPFDPREMCERMMTHVTLVQLTGKQVDPDGEFIRLFAKKGYLASKSLAPAGSGTELDLFPWLRFFGNKCYKNLVELDHTLGQLVNEMKSVAQQEMEDGELEEGLVHALIRAEMAGKLDARAVRQIINDVVLSGTFDTVPTMTASINVLCHHPGIQKKMQEEVDSLSPQQLNNPDRDTAPYIHAYVNEMLRYTSLAPLSVPHKTMRDVTLAGGMIPKGTEVVLDIWALHHDEDFWDQPWKVIPERFLDIDGNAILLGHPNMKHQLSFSAGPRGCPAQALMMKRLLAMHARIMHMFDILPEGDKPTVTCDPHHYQPGMTMNPVPYKIRMVPRKHI